jgi:hypothetical protein
MELKWLAICMWFFWIKVFNLPIIHFWCITLLIFKYNKIPQVASVQPDTKHLKLPTKNDVNSTNWMLANSKQQS